MSVPTLSRNTMLGMPVFQETWNQIEILTSDFQQHQRKVNLSSKIRIVACYRKTSQQIFYMNLVWKSKSHKSLTNGEKSMKLCLHLSSKYTRNPFFSFEVKKIPKSKSAWNFVYILAVPGRFHFNLTNFVVFSRVVSSL